MTFGFTGQAQNVFIQDNGFRQCLNDSYPTFTTADGDSLIISNANAYGGSLDCENYGITNSQGVEYFQSIVNIDFGDNNLQYLPELSSISNLGSLNLTHNQLIALPDLDHMPNLSRIYIDDNQLTQIPKVIESNITSLHFNNNFVTNIDNLGSFTNLEVIYAWQNEISSLPDVSTLNNVRIFHFGFNDLSDFPDISHMTNLERLYIEENNLTQFPQLSTFDSLETLYAYGNDFETIDDISGFVNLTTANISDNRLTFEDILPLSAHADFSNVFYIGDQKSHGFEKSLNLSEGSDLEISTTVDNNVTNIVYELLLDSNVIATNSSGFFELTNLQTTDEGDYQIRITNTSPGLSGIEIYTKPYHVNINPNNNLSFSPNGDGVEDEFYISQNGTAKVYNSKGQMVKELSIPANWDGTNSQGAQLGVGFYIIKINEDQSIRVTLLN